MESLEDLDSHIPGGRTTLLQSRLVRSPLIPVFTHSISSAYDHFTVNLRYSYQPAAVTYVNSVQQVSDVVKIGHDLGYNVVARAGGVSF